jgi:hypothetical protein
LQRSTRNAGEEKGKKRKEQIDQQEMKKRETQSLRLPSAYLGRKKRKPPNCPLSQELQNLVRRGFFFSGKRNIGRKKKKGGKGLGFIIANPLGDRGGKAC